MQAAVLHQLGSLPVYETFPDPIPPNEQQLLMTVKAASIKNIDKIRASGKHYASHTELPTVVGIDGVGVLENGTRVYAQGLTGMIAEKALIVKGRYTILPEKLDDITAAALPNAVMGAALALIFRAELKKDDVVLINGATGVTGRLAVQIANYYGASTVVATGRNEASLEKVKTLGATVVMSLNQPDEAIISQLTEIHRRTPVTVVIDYLWGHPIGLFLKALVSGGAHKVRVVTVGSIAGEEISLASGTLRSSAIELLGSGLGSFSPEALKRFGSEILPHMFQLAADGKLTIETETTALADIETAWQREVAPGKRLVVCM